MYHLQVSTAYSKRKNVVIKESVCNGSLSSGFSVTPPPPNRQSSDSAFSSSHTDFSHLSKPSSSAENVTPAGRSRKRSHESADDASVSSRSHDDKPTAIKRVKELRKLQNKSRRQSPNASLVDSDYEDNSMSHFSVETDSDEPLIHTHKCKHCSKEFKSGTSLSNHMRTHTKEKSLGENALVVPKKNVVDANDSEDKLSCDKCSKTFKLKIMLKRHQESCNKSPQVSPQKELLISLEPIDAAFVPKPIEQSKKLECEMCTTRFKTIENLEKHMRVIHAAVLKKKRTNIERNSDGKLSFPCVYCGMTFDDYYIHGAHFAACPKKDDTIPLQCPVCDRVMSKKSSYFVHIKNMHFWPRATTTLPETKQTFDCRMCHKKLASQDLLVTHLAVHMSNIEDETADDASR